MSKNEKSNAETEAKKSGRPALQEQSIQVELSDKKVKIVRKTNQSIEVINKGKMITLPESRKAATAREKLEKLDSKKDKEAIAKLKQVIADETKKFKNGDIMDKQAKAVLKQIVTEKNLDIDCNRYNTRMLGKNVIAALQSQAS